jgi:hypothetical protein
MSIRFYFDKHKKTASKKRFIPKEGIIPEKAFRVAPEHLTIISNSEKASEVLLSPQAVLALTSNGKNYKNLYNTLQGNLGTFSSSFKRELKGRLSVATKKGKEYRVWKGQGRVDSEGNWRWDL